MPPRERWENMSEVTQKKIHNDSLENELRKEDKKNKCLKSL